MSENPCLSINYQVLSDVPRKSCRNRDITFIDDSGQKLGVAQNVSLKCCAVENIIEFLHRSLEHYDGQNLRIDDLIYMALRELNEKKEEMDTVEKRRILFFSRLQEERPRFTIYHIQLASSLMGAGSLIAFKDSLNLKDDHRLVLGPKIVV